jgi:hypothetical protein
MGLRIFKMIAWYYLPPSASSDQVMTVAVVCSRIISAGAEIAVDAGVIWVIVSFLVTVSPVPCKPHLLI